MVRNKRSSAVGKKKAAPRKRKRSMSGIGNLNIQDAGMELLAVTAGAVAARIASNVILKQWPNTKHIIIGAGQIAGGVLLPNLVKAKWAKNVGLGMMAFGGQVLAVESGVISGIGGIGATSSSTMRYRIGGGPNNIRAINGGPNNIRAINGVPQRYQPKKVEIAGLV